MFKHFLKILPLAAFVSVLFLVLIAFAVEMKSVKLDEHEEAISESDEEVIF